MFFESVSVWSAFNSCNTTDFSATNPTFEVLSPVSKFPVDYGLPLCPGKWLSRLFYSLGSLLSESFSVSGAKLPARFPKYHKEYNHIVVFFHGKHVTQSLPPLKELRLGFPSNPGQCLLVQSLSKLVKPKIVLDILFIKTCKKPRWPVKK